MHFLHLSVIMNNDEENAVAQRNVLYKGKWTKKEQGTKANISIISVPMKNVHGANGWREIHPNYNSFTALPNSIELILGTVLGPRISYIQDRQASWLSRGDQMELNFVYVLYIPHYLA